MFAGILPKNCSNPYRELDREKGDPIKEVWSLKTSKLVFLIALTLQLFNLDHNNT